MIKQAVASKKIDFYGWFEENSFNEIKTQLGYVNQVIEESNKAKGAIKIFFHDSEVKIKHHKLDGTVIDEKKWQVVLERHEAIQQRGGYNAKDIRMMISTEYLLDKNNNTNNAILTFTSPEITDLNSKIYSICYPSESIHDFDFFPEQRYQARIAIYLRKDKLKSGLLDFIQTFKIEGDIKIGLDLFSMFKT